MNESVANPIGSGRETVEAKNRKTRFFTLWVFLIANYLYCDFLTNMETGTLKELLSGFVGPVQVTPTFLLGSAILMEIPIAMIALSRFLPYGANRLANVIAGAIMALVQTASLFVRMPPSPHYMFYSAIEIACTLFIVVDALRWKADAVPDVHGGER